MNFRSSNAIFYGLAFLVQQSKLITNLKDSLGLVEALSSIRVCWMCSLAQFIARCQCYF